MPATSKERSRDYPAVGLRRAVELIGRIYEVDRFHRLPAERAARLIGYGGLNGKSRPLLSALRKFGLLDYFGSGNELEVQLSESAKGILLGTDDGEQHSVLAACLHRPAAFAEVLAQYGESDWPSRETFAKILERDFALLPGAIPGFLESLADSVAYVKEHAPNTPSDSGKQAASPSTKEEELGPAAKSPPKGSLTVTMPGGDAYLVIPDPLGRSEAQRIKLWLEAVVVPTVDFAATGSPDEEE